MENTTTENGLGRLSAKEKISYGFGDVACNVLFALTASMSTYFYTNVIGMSAAVVGTILMLSRMFDGVSDAIIGILVDRTKSKYGKARAWVLWMILPFGVSAVLLFLVPPEASALFQAIYVFVTYNFAVTIVYTALNLPYGTMASLMTHDQNERASLNIYRMTMSPVGALIVTALTMPLINRLGGNQRAWVSVTFAYAIVAMIMLIICFLGCRERVNPVAENAVKDAPTGKSVKAMLRNKYWVNVAIMFILWGMYFSLNGTMVTYYAQYELGNNELMSLITLAEKIPLIMAAVIVAPFIKKYGKRNVTLAGSILFLFGAGIMLIHPHSLSCIVIGSIVRGLGGGAFGALIYSLLADTIEYGHWYTGLRNEGLLYCASSIGYKVGGGLINAFIGFVMDGSGFDGMLTVLPQSAHEAISELYLMTPFVFYGGIVVCLLFYRLDKEYPVIIEELKAGRCREGVEILSQRAECTAD